MKSEEDLASANPDYLSYDEWRERREKRQKLVLRLLLRFASMAVAAGMVYFAIGFGRTYTAKQALLTSLSRLGDYEIRVDLVAPNRQLVGWGTSTFIGQDWQETLADGRLRFTKHGSKFCVDDLAGHLTRWFTSWNGVPPFLSQVAAAANSINPIAFLSPNRRLLTGKNDLGGVSYTFNGLGERWSVNLDAKGRPATIVSSGGELGGLGGQIVATITPTNSFAPYDLYKKSEPAQKPQVVNVPRGLKVVSAEMNVRGDAFFIVSGTGWAISGTEGIVREHQDRYYNSDVVPEGQAPNETTELRFTTLDDIPTEWPTTLHITMQKAGVSKAEFRYTFPKPTCDLLPDFEVVAGDDHPYYQMLCNSAQHRANYFANVYHVNGKATFRRGFEPYAGATPSERAEGENENLLYAFYSRGLDTP